MSTVWHRHPEKRRLWLDLLFDVQDGNLLGHQTSPLGTKCKKIFTCTRSKKALGWFLIQQNMTFSFCCHLQGNGDTSGGCRCRVDRKPCHPNCQNCHWGRSTLMKTQKNFQLNAGCEILYRNRLVIEARPSWLCRKKLCNVNATYKLRLRRWDYWDLLIQYINTFIFNESLIFTLTLQRV